MTPHDTPPDKERLLQEHFSRALAHQAAGQLSEAEARCRQILEMEPRQPDAMHLLAVLAFQTGNQALAVDLAGEALASCRSAAHFCDYGNIFQLQGRLDEAVACYRRALALQPDHVEAHYNLGNALRTQGHIGDAIASYRDALRFKPDFAEAHNNLGTLLQGQGNLDEAAASYRQALAFKPGHESARFNLAGLLQLQGKADQAIACYKEGFDSTSALEYCNLGKLFKDQGDAEAAMRAYQQATSLRPDYAEAHYNLANALREQNRLEEAVDAYRRAIASRPDFAEAYNNMGAVLQTLGQLEPAADALRKAVALRPAYPDAHHNLGRTLNQLGQLDDAVASHRRALELDEQPGYRIGFAQTVKRCVYPQDNPEMRKLLVRAVTESWGWQSELAPVSLSLIRTDARIKEYFERASRAWPQCTTGTKLFELSELMWLARDTLFRSLLESTVIPELGTERLLTFVRSAFLGLVSDGGLDELDDDLLRFQCAVARQCFITEYVYACQPEELRRAELLGERLTAALRDGSTIRASWISTVASYFPLLSIAGAEGLPGRPFPDAVRALLTQQIEEPLRERAYRDTITKLTPVEGGVSTSVREQYEDNPYPKWTKVVQPPSPLPLEDYLRERFPRFQFPAAARKGATALLIAGCGTGLESINYAQRLRNARILAVDLSLSSLSYAKRKTQELGMANIEYAQADILRLGSIDRTFDVISSMGVLHHLADPEAGLRQLLSLLRPDGFMALGLYSERAREAVVAGRKFITQQSYASDPVSIRQCRQDILARKNDATLQALTGVRDFFVTSECRDLLFHVQEHRFTLPQIKLLLSKHGLRFIGFSSIEQSILQRYAERFTDDKTQTNLDYWDYFEAEFPNAFIGMYQFWVQRAGA